MIPINRYMKKMCFRFTDNGVFGKGNNQLKTSIFSKDTEPSPDRWLIVKVIHSNQSHGWLMDTEKFSTGIFAKVGDKELRTWKKIRGGFSGLDPALMGATRRKPKILRPGEEYTVIEVFEAPAPDATEVELRVAIGDAWHLVRTEPFLRQTIKLTDVPQK